MATMIIGTDKTQNCSIRVVHQNDGSVKVVVVDKNNEDKVVGVVAQNVVSGTYVDCDLTNALHLTCTGVSPIQIDEPKKYRSVKLIDIKGNDVIASTVLVVKGDEDQDSAWVGLSMSTQMFIDLIVKTMNSTIPNFCADNYLLPSEGSYTFYGDTFSQTLYVEDSVAGVTYKISYDDIKTVISSKFGGEANV